PPPAAPAARPSTALADIAAAPGRSPARAARSFANKPAYLRAIVNDLNVKMFPPRPEVIPDALAELHAAVDRLLGEAALEARILARALAEPGLDSDSAGVIQSELLDLIEVLGLV